MPALTRPTVQPRVADAVFETDPVDAVAAAVGVAVAKVHAPLRRMLFRNILERTVHRAALARHAPRLPLAIDADV